MELINKIKHFIDYGRKGCNPMQPVEVIYNRFYDLPIKAVWSMEIPNDIDEKEYLDEERIKNDLARKLAEEIKNYMRYEERPPLITNLGTKRVEYEAEIKILVNGHRSI